MIMTESRVVPNQYRTVPHSILIVPSYGRPVLYCEDHYCIEMSNGPIGTN